MTDHVLLTLVAHATILAGQVIGFVFQYLIIVRRHRWSMEKLGSIEREVKNGHTT